MREQRNPELVPGWFLLLCLFLIWCGIAFGQTRQLSTGLIDLTSLPIISPDSQRAVYADAAGLWSVPLHGGPSTLLAALGSRQLFGAAQITPDGSRVVYISDQDTLGKPELYSVPITGGTPTRISKAMAADRQVRDFLISPTSQRVYYAADGDTNNVIELFRVDIGGGPTTKLNQTISGNYDIFEYQASPTDHVAYRVGRSTVGGHELWTVPGNGRGSQARKISRAMVTGGGVQSDWRISEERAVYRCDCEVNGLFNLYSVPVTGGESVRVSDGPPPMPEPVRSPDGAWIVYGAGVGLWSSGPDGDHKLVSCAGQTVTAKFLGKPAYSVSADSRTVLYVAGALWSGPISGAVCELFRNGFETGTAGAWIVVE